MQRTPGETTPSRRRVRTDRCAAARATGAQRGVVERAALDDAPLEPRRMKAPSQVPVAVAQLRRALRPHRTRTPEEAALQCRGGDTKHRPERWQVPGIGLQQSPRIRYAAMRGAKCLNRTANARRSPLATAAPARSALLPLAPFLGPPAPSRLSPSARR